MGIAILIILIIIAVGYAIYAKNTTKDLLSQKIEIEAKMAKVIADYEKKLADSINKASSLDKRCKVDDRELNNLKATVTELNNTIENNQQVYRNEIDALIDRKKRMEQKMEQKMERAAEYNKNCHNDLDVELNILKSQFGDSTNMNKNKVPKNEIAKEVYQKIKELSDERDKCRQDLVKSNIELKMSIDKFNAAKPQFVGMRTTTRY